MIKKITLFIFENYETYTQLHQFLLDSFVYDRNIYEEVIEKLEEEKLFEVIAFLKNDIHSEINQILLLNYEIKNNIALYLSLAQKLEILDIQERIDFLILKENEF